MPGAYASVCVCGGDGWEWDWGEGLVLSMRGTLAGGGEFGFEEEEALRLVVMEGRK